MTKNIPQRLPFQIPKDLESQIMNWIASRPEHEADTGLSRRARWTFSSTDHSIVTHYQVRDNATGDVFSPEIDVSTM